MNFAMMLCELEGRCWTAGFVSCTRPSCDAHKSVTSLKQTIVFADCMVSNLIALQ